MNGIINHLGSSGIPFSSLKMNVGHNRNYGVELGRDLTASYDVILGVILQNYELTERHHYVASSKTDTVVERREVGSIPSFLRSVEFFVYQTAVGNFPVYQAVCANLSTIETDGASYNSYFAIIIL